jgi:hypothetical protein
MPTKKKPAKKKSSFKLSKGDAELVRRKLKEIRAIGKRARSQSK